MMGKKGLKVTLVSVYCLFYGGNQSIYVCRLNTHIPRKYITEKTVENLLQIPLRKDSVVITGVNTISIVNLSVEMYSARILKQSMGARNRVGIGLSCWPDRLHSLAELVP